MIDHAAIDPNAIERHPCQRFTFCQWRVNRHVDDLGRIVGTWTLYTMHGAPHIMVRCQDGVGAGAIACRMACDLDAHDSKMLYDEACKMERNEIGLP
jgi:hypothetical protein